MKKEQEQQKVSFRGFGDKSNGEDESVGTSLLFRLKSLGADFLVLAVGVLLLCGMAFLVVFLFRMGNVGKTVVSAVSSCSAVLTAAAWPILISVLVVLYRRHVVEALRELPCFIKAYAATEMRDKLSVAPPNGGNERHVETGCQDGMMDKMNAEDARAALKGHSCDENGGKHVKREQGVANDTFVEAVLSAMQDECGEFVYRSVNLFSVRNYRFDGAIVRENRITGIVVSRGDVGDDRSRLNRVGEFYRAVSKRDRQCFDLIYCIPDGQNVRAAALREHCRLQGLDFPVTFRIFANEQSRQS